MSITARGLISQACTGWGEISNENDNALQRKIEGKPYRPRARSESYLLTDDCGSLIEPLRNSARSKLWSLRRFRAREKPPAIARPRLSGELFGLTSGWL